MLGLGCERRKLLSNHAHGEEFINKISGLFALKVKHNDKKISTRILDKLQIRENGGIDCLLKAATTPSTKTVLK